MSNVDIAIVPCPTLDDHIVAAFGNEVKSSGEVSALIAEVEAAAVAAGEAADQATSARP